MVTITHYAIDPRTDNVRVEYSYSVRDEIAGEDIGRGNVASLTDGAGPLADPKWGNEELCAALAASLNIDAALVSIVAPS